jgi:hypothetical protein
MLLTVTAAGLATVLLDTSETLKVIPGGTVTRACSVTSAVRRVVWLLSGRLTVVWAIAATESTKLTALKANSFLQDMSTSWSLRAHQRR